MNAQPPVSLTQHVEALDMGEHVVALAWLKDAPAFALAGGAVRLGQARSRPLSTCMARRGCWLRPAPAMRW